MSDQPPNKLKPSSPPGSGPHGGQTPLRGWTLIRYKVGDPSAGNFQFLVEAEFGHSPRKYRVTIPVSEENSLAVMKCPGVVTSYSLTGNVPETVRLMPLRRFSTVLRLLGRPIFQLLGHPKQAFLLINKLIAATYRYKLVGLLTVLREFIFHSIPCVKNEYSIWIENFDTPSIAAQDEMHQHIKRMGYHPRFSIILPVFNTPEIYLRRAIDSVVQQLYPHWELCIADDKSTAPHVKQVLESYLHDTRIRTVFRPSNGHISEASNSALELATGDFVVLLDHDDELTPDALYWVAARLDQNPELDFIYSDEDKIDAHGRRFDPHFKTDWNPDLFLSYNLITHMACIRRTLVSTAGRFRKGFEGSQDYDLFLRVLALTSQIAHIPRILYHWRAIAGSTALAPEAKRYAHENARRSIREYLHNRETPAQVIPGFDSYHRVVYPLPVVTPLVSIIICTRDRKDLLEGIVSDILRRTTYTPIEVIIVNNQSRHPATLDYLQSLAFESRIRVLDYDHPFNYSAMNNWASSLAKGEILAFLNNDLRVITPEWLSEMVRIVLQPRVGAVGAKLYYADKTIQHAGVILGIGGVAGHPMKHQVADSRYFMGRANVVQAFSAVTGACLVIQKRLFTDIGQFDEVELPIAFSDVDLGIRLRQKGYRNIWTPYAELFHLESATRGSDEAPDKIERFRRENRVMQTRWGELLTQDPYYNPNLTLDEESCTPAFPPRRCPSTFQLKR